MSSKTISWTRWRASNPHSTRRRHSKEIKDQKDEDGVEERRRVSEPSRRRSGAEDRRQSATEGEARALLTRPPFAAGGSAVRNEEREPNAAATARSSGCPLEDELSP
jgi:hypothetical protein